MILTKCLKYSGLDVYIITSSLETFLEAGMLPKVIPSDPAGMDSLLLWLIEPNTMGDPILETEKLNFFVSRCSELPHVDQNKTCAHVLPEAMALLTTALGGALFTAVGGDFLELKREVKMNSQTHCLKWIICKGICATSMIKKGQPDHLFVKDALFLFTLSRVNGPQG